MTNVTIHIKKFEKENAHEDKPLGTHAHVMMRVHPLADVLQTSNSNFKGKFWFMTLVVVGFSLLPLIFWASHMTSISALFRNATPALFRQFRPFGQSKKTKMPLSSTTPPKSSKMTLRLVSINPITCRSFKNSPKNL